MAGSVGDADRFAVEADLNSFDRQAAEVELDQLRIPEDELDWKVEFDWGDWFWRAYGDHGFGVVGKDDAAGFVLLLVLFAVLLDYVQAVVDDELVEGGGGDGADFRLGGGADPVCTSKRKLKRGWFPIAGRTKGLPAQMNIVWPGQRDADRARGSELV